MSPKVTIIGAGRVGALAPACAGPGGAAVIRNHLQAADAAGAQVVRLIDASPDALKRAQSLKYFQPSTECATELPNSLPADSDIIVLATPPADRIQTVKRLLQAAPAVLLIEKPLEMTSKGCTEILRECARTETQVFVSFNRRFDPFIRDFWRNMPIDRGFSNAIFRYSKGLFNNASHMVDHIIQNFGSVKAVQADPFSLQDARKITDNDCISFRCFLESGGKVELIGFQNVDYDMFECDVYFSDCLHSFRNNGAERYRFQCEPDLWYPGYSGLVPVDSGIQNAPIGGFVEMHRAMYKAAGFDISGDPGQLCRVETAAYGIDVLTAAITSASDGGRVVPLGQPLGTC